MTTLSVTRPKRECQESEESNKSVLRILREKKNFTQAELARRIKASRKKLHTIERKNPNQIELGEIDLFAKALGYRFGDVAHLIRASFQENAGIKKISLNTPAYEMNFGEGTKVHVLIHEEQGSFLGLLQICPGKSLKRESLPIGDLMLGVIFEGTLLVDCLGTEYIFKGKDRDVFYLNHHLPFEFYNNDSCRDLSILIFSARFSHL